MIGTMSVCTMYTVHTTKMYDTWDAGRVGKVSGIEVTGRVLGMPDMKCPAQSYLSGARNAHNAKNF